MATKTVTFTANDGNEFSTLEEAKIHDQLTKATSEFAEAKDRLGRALASTQKTADGISFDLDRWQNYFFISQRHNSVPTLCEVDAKSYSRLDWELNDNRFAINIDVYGDGKSRARYYTDELYSEKVNAVAELKRKLLLHIDHVREMMDRLGK